MAEPIGDIDKLCLHTVTTRPWNIEIAIEEYARSGIRGITIWRDALQDYDPKKIRKKINDAGMQVVSLCRGGFFPSVEKEKREAAIRDNLEAIKTAELIGAPSLVLVPGADSRQSLETSRTQMEEGISTVEKRAGEAGVKLSIEALHPMYAGTRSAVNTLAQANDICDHLMLPHVGVAVDVYHLWWDPDLRSEISRSGKEGRLFAFHVSDWLDPMEDLLNDRGLMGEGCIPVPRIRGWMEDAGYNGFIEVEIFSTRRWTMDQSRNLREIIQAYLNHT